MYFCPVEVLFGPGRDDHSDGKGTRWASNFQEQVLSKRETIRRISASKYEVNRICAEELCSRQAVPKAQATRSLSLSVCRTAQEKLLRFIQKSEEKNKKSCQIRETSQHSAVQRRDGKPLANRARDSPRGTLLAILLILNNSSCPLHCLLWIFSPCKKNERPGFHLPWFIAEVCC